MKALLVLLAVSGAALADDRALLHCRTIADVAARVACYDAIPVAPATPGKMAGTPERTAAPPAPVAAVSGPASFGLSTVEKRKTEEPSSIESTVVGKIEGWGPNTRFTLANGQVWRVVDGSSEWFMERVNPKVVLTRNAIGTIFFEVDGAKQPPRVRRVE